MLNQAISGASAAIVDAAAIDASLLFNAVDVIMVPDARSPRKESTTDNKSFIGLKVADEVIVTVDDGVLTTVTGDGDCAAISPCEARSFWLAPSWRRRRRKRVENKEIKEQGVKQRIKKLGQTLNFIGF